jgi:hypothetical protein
VQRHAQAILPFSIQPMETGGVDAGDRIARDNLTGRDVRGRIDGELQWDRQFGQVDVVRLQGRRHPTPPRSTISQGMYF